jgi:hypothetical protein
MAKGLSSGLHLLIRGLSHCIEQTFLNSFTPLSKSDMPFAARCKRRLAEVLVQYEFKKKNSW